MVVKTLRHKQTKQFGVITDYPSRIVDVLIPKLYSEDTVYEDFLLYKLENLDDYELVKLDLLTTMM